MHMQCSTPGEARHPKHPRHSQGESGNRLVEHVPRVIRKEGLIRMAAVIPSFATTFANKHRNIIQPPTARPES